MAIWEAIERLMPGRTEAQAMVAGYTSLLEDDGFARLDAAALATATPGQRAAYWIHRLADDAALSTAPVKLIQEHACNAEWALKLQRDALVAVFEAMDDAYIDQFTVRGQYGPGDVGGTFVPGYRQEQDVACAHAMPSSSRYSVMKVRRRR